MDVVDTVCKLLNKIGRIEKLMNEVAWVKIDTKAGAVADGIECFASRHKIVSNFGRMYFQAKLYAFLVKYIDNWIPASREIPVSFLDFCKVVWRERIQQMPDRRSAES